MVSRTHGMPVHSEIIEIISTSQNCILVIIVMKEEPFEWIGPPRRFL